MKVLFITHNSKRAGAPKVLLFFLQWLQQNSKIEFDVLDLLPGDLQNDFKAVSSHYYQLPKKVKKSRILSKFTSKSVENQLVSLLNFRSYDLIYANTVKAIPVGVHLKDVYSKSKLIVHIHELPVAIALLLPNISNYIKDIDKIIAVSNLVKTSLIENFDFQEDKIDLVYEFSDNIPKKVGREIVLNKQETFRIGASGHVDWRKGADVFIQVARSFFKQYPKAEVDFVWVGDVKATDRLILEADIVKLGLQGRVSFIGEQVNPSVYFSSFDVFLMCSREDPFPLVCIEVGQLGIPIICFENAVGTSEILQEGGGKVVPYLDIEAMTGEVITYFKEPSLCVEDGKQAKEVFQGFHVNQQAPKLMHIMNQLIS